MRSDRRFLSGLALFLLAAGDLALAQLGAPVYEWTTWAGRASTGEEDGPAAQARFNVPSGLAHTPAGDIVIADTGNHTIRLLRSDGTVATVAGKAGEPGTADGPAATARFKLPRAVAVDGQGRIFVADAGNFTIRRIELDGSVATVAGIAGHSGRLDGPAAGAHFGAMESIAVDAQGVIYVADGGLRRIANGQVTSVLEFEGVAVPDATGTVKSTRIVPGRALAIGPDGALLFSANLGHDLFSLGAQAIFRWDGGVPTHVRTYQYPTTSHAIRAIALRGDGELYVADSSSAPPFTSERLDHIRGGGTVHHLRDAAGRSDRVSGLTIDRQGRPVFTVESDDAIRRIATSGQIEVAAGTPWIAEGTGDDLATVRFSGIKDLAVGNPGIVWAADGTFAFGEAGSTEGFAIRRIDQSGQIRTAATTTSGNPAQNAVTALGVDGENFLYARADRALVWADGSLRRIGTDTDSLVRNGSGFVFMAHHLAYQIDPGADPRPLAGSDEITVASVAARAPDGEIYFFNRFAGPPIPLWRLRSDRTVTRVVENLQIRRPDWSEVNPRKLAVDLQGNFIVTYPPMHEVRLVRPNGESHVIGGRDTQGGSRDGRTGAALFHWPQSVVVDARGDIFVADGFGTTIRRGRYVGIAPAITAHPQSTSATTGAQASFSVTATGDPAPTYQWRKNGAAIAGATAPQLGLSAVRAEDAGEYTVVVTTPVGSVTSNAATLTVTGSPPPSPPPSGAGGGSGGGGGAPSGWFLAALAALSVLRRARR